MRMYMRCMYHLYMQRMYRTREMQTKAKEILDAAEAGEDVRITRNGKVFKVVLADAEPAGPLEALMGTGSDDLLAQLLEQSSQQTDLLRQLVEHKDTVLDDLIEQTQRSQAAEAVTSGMVTVRVDEVAQRPAVVIPERVEDLKPEPPGEPTQDELSAAHEYFGLRETPNGAELTPKGIQSALAHLKKASRDEPDSVKAKVIRMDPSSEDRIEFLRCYQLDRFTKALAKRAAGDRRWLGAATPPRF